MADGGRVTVQQRGRRGRKGNRERELRNRLTRSAARMHAKHLDPTVLDLYTRPAKIGMPIYRAWNAKEDLLDLLALARTLPSRVEVSRRLTRFYEACADSRLPELERLAATVSAWWLEILAFIHSGVGNAGSEGTNRVIKTIARDAYGTGKVAAAAALTSGGCVADLSALYLLTPIEDDDRIRLRTSFGRIIVARTALADATMTRDQFRALDLSACTTSVQPDGTAQPASSTYLTHSTTPGVALLPLTRSDWWRHCEPNEPQTWLLQIVTAAAAHSTLQRRPSRPLKPPSSERSTPPPRTWPPSDSGR